MSNNSKFVRKFIILKKEYSNMRNLNPKGHGKIELRGSRLNISLNIENGEKNTYYNVILLSGIKNYEVGKIYLEDRTKGKGDFKLNYKDLESSGFSIDKINAILILRDNKVLLGNYINKEDGSIERYLNENIKDTEDSDVGEVSDLPEEAETVEYPDIDEVPYYTEEPQDIEIPETAGDSNLGQVSDLPDQEQKSQQNEEKSESVKPKIDDSADVEGSTDVGEVSDLPKKADDLEVTQREYEKAITTVFEPNKSRVNVTTPNKLEKKEKKENRDQTTDYILNILSFFPYAEPFKIDLKGYNWWRIDIDTPLEEKGFLPYFSYITGESGKYSQGGDGVNASELMEIHKHYLFGLYNQGEEVKFYVYGIPGSFISKEHPGKGTTGFSTWFEGKEENGYWLLYIEPSTGRIIYPINPMIPKD